MKIDRGQAERINKIINLQPFPVGEGQDVEVHIPFNIAIPVKLTMTSQSGEVNSGTLESTDMALRISTILHEKYLSGLLTDPTED